MNNQVATMATTAPAAKIEVAFRNRIAHDVATLLTGTMLSALFGVLHVFVIPRVISVEDFGYWRLFLLYVAYGGLLHMGFPDGALLSWAGKPLSEFTANRVQAVRFLVLQHAVLVLPIAAILWVVFRADIHLRTIAIAVLLAAILLNINTLLLVMLQAGRVFRPVALAQMLPIASVVIFAILARSFGRPDFRYLIAFYVLGIVAAIGYLWRVTRSQGKPANAIAPMSFIAIGWPVLLGNVALALVQNTDRLVCSSVFPIADFAQYSLAASTLMVPITVIGGVSRVFLPHFAATDRSQHPRLYRRTSRLILLAWSVSLSYYVAVDAFVHRVIPKYEASLPLARVLLLGTVFFGAIQILHATLYNLYGRQREFLRSAILALLLALAGTVFAAVYFRSLLAVAIAQVMAVIAWWIFGSWRLRSTTHEGWRDWLHAVGVFAWSAAVLYFSVHFFNNVFLRALSYCIAASALLVIVSRPEINLLRQLLRLRQLAAGLVGEHEPSAETRYAP
jgi:O-antigen/teichoic acid export membrane protein